MRLRTAATVVLAVLAWSVPAAPQAKTALPEKYRRWLDEEVVYIVTPVEREVFLRLGSDRERDMFVEAFWKQRDPTPNTAENEFRTEHARRIDHANRYLGREASRPGWRTDRGRVYIILGPPGDVQRFQGKQGVYNCESWFYQGKEALGLPPGFNLLFYQQHNVGEYRLYSPASDGPMALLNMYDGTPNDFAAAYEALQEIDGALADLSMSLIPGEPSTGLGRPSLVSEGLLQKVAAAPRRLVEDKYAREFLRYKDRVEVEYSANFLDSDGFARVLRDASGTSFVHYALEPRRLSVDSYEGTYSTTLKVVGSVTTLDGRPVYQYENAVPVREKAERMRDLASRPFAFHDLFPLVAGEFRLSLIVKNEASKEFMTFDAVVRVPEDRPERPALTPPLLGYRAEKADPANRRLKAFRYGETQVLAQPGRVFVRDDTLVVALQALGVTPELRDRGSVRFVVSRDGETVRDQAQALARWPDPPNVVEAIPLSALPPAHYRLEVTLVDDGAAVAKAAEEFEVSYAPAIARPWVQSRVLPPADDPVHQGVLGAELLSLGRLPEARARLEEMTRRRPDSVEAALALARVYLQTGEAAKAAAILRLHADGPETPRYEVLFLAGQAARAAGDPAGAVALFERAVGHYGVNASLLNAIGDAEAARGRAAEALTAYEKSLKLSPDQPEIRRRAEELRKRL